MRGVARQSADLLSIRPLDSRDNPVRWTHDRPNVYDNSPI